MQRGRGFVTRVRGGPFAGEALGFGALTCGQLFRDQVEGLGRSVQSNITR